MNDAWYDQYQKTYTVEEERYRSENVHLAGCKRFRIQCYPDPDHFKEYTFRNEKFIDGYVDSIFDAESDNIEDLYAKIGDFIYNLADDFPIVLYDNFESDKFFDRQHYNKDRGYVKINDRVNNTNITIKWDDIIKQYHLMKIFRAVNFNHMGEEHNDEKE